MKSDNLKPAPASLDALMLARVLVMPGAAELFDAFARIPPGALRESVIQHAQVIAETYTGAPASMQQPDPLLTAAQAQAPRPVLEAPRKPVKTDDPNVRAVELRLQGIHAQQIAKRLDMPYSHVTRALAEAKRAGVQYPNLRTKPRGRPLEVKEFKTSFNDLSGQGVAIVEKAAVARGISPAEYLRRKALAVTMAQQGLGYPEIVTATGESQKSVSLWLSNARAAGISIPYAARPAIPAKFEDVPPAPANVIRPTRFFGPFEALPGPAKYQVRQAATRRNMTPDAFLDLQQSVVLNRMAGMGPAEIAAMCGESDTFVKDVIARTKQKGAVFPPVVHNASFRKAVANG
jgi:transposase